MYLWRLVVQEEEEDIYTDIQQLRDQSDELRSKMEDKEESGDVLAAARLRTQLDATERALMEKSQERSTRHSARG